MSLAQTRRPRPPIAMFDIVRTSLHRVITTPAGDRFLPVRLPKDLARRVNVMLGEPLCSQTELDRRRAGRAKLEALKHGDAKASATANASAEQAPVLIYFEGRSARNIGRICEMLDKKAIAYTTLDLGGDEVTKEFVLRTAKCKEDGLPVVFVASTPVGGYDALVEWDASGRLADALAGR